MIKFLIASPLESKRYEGLDAIYLVATEGERGILKDHIALVCGLKNGSPRQTCFRGRGNPAQGRRRGFSAVPQ